MNINSLFNIQLVDHKKNKHYCAGAIRTIVGHQNYEQHIDKTHSSIQHVHKLQSYFFQMESAFLEQRKYSLSIDFYYLWIVWSKKKKIVGFSDCGFTPH